MAWHLRKKPSGIKKIPKIPSIKPIKPIKPIEPIRPIKPIAPIGYEYYWKTNKKSQRAGGSQFGELSRSLRLATSIIGSQTRNCKCTHPCEQLSMHKGL